MLERFANAPALDRVPKHGRALRASNAPLVSVVVLASNENPLAVRAQRHGADAIWMLERLPNRPSRCNLKDLGEVVFASGRDVATVRAEGRGEHVGLVV